MMCAPEALTRLSATVYVLSWRQKAVCSAVVGAVGALKGPLHGGAPGPALETVFQIADPSRAESVLRGKIEASG